MRIILCLVLNVLFFVPLVYAGGAVAARQGAQKQMMQQKQQQQAQQQMMMQQRMQAEQAQKIQVQEKIKHEQEGILNKQHTHDELLERAHQEDNAREHELEAQVKDVVDINDLIASFETSSQAWPLIIDQEAKSVVISAYIDQYRKQGIGINKSSDYYAELIDAMTQQSADMLNQPLKQVLKILAILEYDFNNGQNKDDLALKILGNQQAVMQNKKRLGL